jgi:aspartyl-tRNA(Asn)/glutamyl-tRNA(Gln) amidotransferase subunit A
MRIFDETCKALSSGEISSEELLAEAQKRVADADAKQGTGTHPSVGGQVFIELDEHAQEKARAIDLARAAGDELPAHAGIPISIKDLFDVQGQVTRAGSVVLEEAAPAAKTAPAIQRLLDAGLVPVGRTNMTEFAYSGVGLNPHYGTPLNPWDRQTGRIPGGSSSGAAVSVTDGMAVAGIGTDTGGSCRIPAALTGITGWKPSANRVPREGVYPLSFSLDSVGVLARDVAGCAALDDLMAGGAGRVPAPRQISELRLAVLDHYVVDGMDDEVSRTYESALNSLSAAGATLERLQLPMIERLPELNARGGIAAREAWDFHAELLASSGDGYDPRVAGRIRAGAQVDDEELAAIRAARQEMTAAFANAMARFDAVLAPTVPIVAPPLAAFEQDDEYVRLNLLLLRNPSLFNFLDGCAISLPIQNESEPPVGLMLAAPNGQDLAVLGVAGGIEQEFLAIDRASSIS